MAKEKKKVVSTLIIIAILCSPMAEGAPLPKYDLLLKGGKTHSSFKLLPRVFEFIVIFHVGLNQLPKERIYVTYVAMKCNAL